MKRPVFAAAVAALALFMVPSAPVHAEWVVQPGGVDYSGLGDPIYSGTGTVATIDSSLSPAISITSDKTNSGSYYSGTWTGTSGTLSGNVYTTYIWQGSDPPSRYPIVHIMNKASGRASGYNLGYAGTAKASSNSGYAMGNAEWPNYLYNSSYESTQSYYVDTWPEGAISPRPPDDFFVTIGNDMSVHSEAGGGGTTHGEAKATSTYSLAAGELAD